MMINIENVSKVMKKHHMVRDGERVMIGVSGGADSMCLLFLMSELRKSLGFSLEAVHVHHGIRGKSADEDLKFVEEQCRMLDVPFKAVRVNIPEIAEEKGLSEEEAGRIKRYEIFRESGADRIAVAHHLEDSAETILFNLFRGTGVQGLSGIRPVAGDIIRPLIYNTRKEIEDYCRDKGIKYREDETNRDVGYSRNRIRLNILPEAEKINSGAVKHIGEAGERLSELWDYVEREAEKVFNECTKTSAEGKLILDTERLLAEEPVIRSIVLRKCITRAAGREKDISAVHVKDTESLLYGSSGKELSLPYKVSVKKSFDRLIFSGEEKEKKEYGEIPFIVDTEGAETVLQLPDGSRVSGCITEKPENIPVLTYTKWLDYDKIKGAAVWRTRRKGDRISIQGGSKKLKELFIEEKISADERDSIYVLADEEEIIWVPGIRIGHEFKVTEETKRVLKVSMNT